MVTTAQVPEEDPTVPEVLKEADKNVSDTQGTEQV